MIERMIVQFSEASTFNCSLDAGSADFVATWGESFLPPEYEGPTEVTPDETQHILETRGMILGSDITVDAIPDDYVGSAITRRSQSDVTVSGPAVSAPSGYYEESVSGTVQSGSVSVPNKSMTATPSIDVSASGLITALVSSTKTIAPSVSEGYVTTGSSGTVTASGVSTTQLTTQAGMTITPTESEQTAVQAGRYTTGDVKVGAISSTYVGSDVPRHDSDDLSVSGATVTAPSGHYEAAASATVASGTEGTPSASKGTVSSHSVAVTPSVTNSEGYISGGTHTGTPVTVSASELVSGTYSVTSSGTKDVTNYQYASIAAGTEGTPTASKSTVSGHAVTVTPSVTNSAGYITGGTKTGTGVSVSASELVSGTYNVTSSGTKDVTNYASASVPAGTAGTPTATKGTVSGHAVTVTPSVTNATGFITGSTKTGTGVSVSASELVSGTKSITSNGTNIDVTEYAAVDVAVSGGGTPTIEALTVTPTESQQTFDGTGALLVSSNNFHTPTVTLASGSTYTYSADAVYDSMFYPVPGMVETYDFVWDGTGLQQTFSDGSRAYTLNISSSGTVSLTGLSGLDQINYSLYSASVDGYLPVTVDAISSTYVGSDIPTRSSTDLSASGATVTAPAGYYASNATKTVSSGTEGTPTATKGTVSSNRVTVTPSVTNSAGYISGGTHTGTGVTVQASELVSGTKTITASGTTDVANYANASVAAGSATVPSTASGTGATASQSGTTLTLTKTISMTPTVSAGYVASGTAGNIALTISATDANFDAANIKSGVTLFGKTGTYTGGGGGGSGLTLLATKSLGTISTSSTSAADSGKNITVTGYNDYDVLIVDVSVDSTTNNRHTSTVSFVILTGTSNVATKNTYTVASNKWNSKLGSTGTGSTRQSTTAYGIYANSATVSGSTMTIPFYQRYNSNNTGTINGSYTARVYGVKLYDLIGG